MKTAISILDAVFEAAEAIAQQLGVSRSEFYTPALQAYLEKYSRSERLTKLNEIYAEAPSDVDLTMAKMQAMSLPYEEW